MLPRTSFMLIQTNITQQTQSTLPAGLAEKRVEKLHSLFIVKLKRACWDFHRGARLQGALANSNQTVCIVS